MRTIGLSVMCCFLSCGAPVERPGEGWLLGVQWHPERIAEVDPSCSRLAEELVARAARTPRRDGGGSL